MPYDTDFTALLLKKNNTSAFTPYYLQCYHSCYTAQVFDRELQWILAMAKNGWKTAC